MRLASPFAALTVACALAPHAALAGTDRFLTLCKAASLAPDAEHTVRTMLQDALDRESLELPARTPEACEAAAAELAQRTGFFLVAKDLVDVAPIATLDHLETLYLSHNRIADVRPLAGLRQLRVLDLEDNAVRDASPLRGLRQLTELDLDGNPIEIPAALPPPPPPAPAKPAPPPYVVHETHVHHDRGWVGCCWYPWHGHGYYGHHHYGRHRHHHRDHSAAWFTIGLGAGWWLGSGW
jgi:hypothetical protein